jgi:hypothetical protein
MRERIVLIDQIRPQLQAVARAARIVRQGAREQQPLVASAIDFLKTRDESWRLRKEALRKSNLQILRQADSVERISIDKFRKLKAAATS